MPFILLLRIYNKSHFLTALLIICFAGKISGQIFNDSISEKISRISKLDKSEDFSSTHYSGIINGEHYVLFKEAIVVEMLFIAKEISKDKYQLIDSVGISKLEYPQFAIKDNLLYVMEQGGHHGVYSTNYVFGLDYEGFYLLRIVNQMLFPEEYDNSTNYEIWRGATVLFDKNRTIYWIKRYNLKNEKHQKDYNVAIRKLNAGIEAKAPNKECKIHFENDTLYRFNNFVGMPIHSRYIKYYYKFIDQDFELVDF